MPTLRTAFLTGLALVVAAPLAAAQTVDRSEVSSMVSWVNAERARAGLPALVEDPRLDAVAEGHSLEMARTNRFSHESPATGSPSDRVTRAGLSWRAVAENIAMNQSAELAQRSLVASPGHHENMVDPAQRSIGIGIVRHDGRVWVTQLFATLNGAAAVAPTAPSAPTPSVTAPPAQALEAGDEEASCDEESCDEEGDDEAGPVDLDSALGQGRAAQAPTAAPTPPTRAPARPAQGAPQGLEQFLSNFGITLRPTPAPARANGARGARFFIVETPLGPMRVEVPEGSARDEHSAPVDLDEATRAPAAPAAPAARPRTNRAPRRRAAPPAQHRAPSRGRVVVVDHLDV
ncbi:MAG: CAP domain-containing protein [Polyangiales bacterium]